MLFVSAIIKSYQNNISIYKRTYILYVLFMIMIVYIYIYIYTYIYIYIIIMMMMMMIIAEQLLNS